jgi:signal transduction histidine kinase
MLIEARESLRGVSERTQQILRTVRRDLDSPIEQKLNLNDVAQSLYRQWHDLAEHQWKLDLIIKPSSEPVYIQGDASHLQQALENLLCNSRDATFEQRIRMRELARSTKNPETNYRKDRLLAAAGWKGNVTITIAKVDQHALLTISDNGIGMSEEVLKRCTEAHLTTKRDNALHEGLASGMRLGLSFVAWVVEQHHGKLEITSTLHQGTTLRMIFPLAQAAAKAT